MSIILYAISVPKSPIVIFFRSRSIYSVADGVLIVAVWLA